MDRKKKTLEEVMDEYDQWLINWLIVYGESEVSTEGKPFEAVEHPDMYSMALVKTHLRFAYAPDDIMVKLSRTGLDYIKLISRNE